ncbi:MliC family protein [uncultured Cohaesibacter sp.]|uniref:MliC family protein n=1 Tax=uncultured Cohaesibacter sp. TaxID=1002546 RepID=UPI0029C82982|nr:MliC family protein [uncultured Cohaesibacter sp.]
MSNLITSKNKLVLAALCLVVLQLPMKRAEAGYRGSDSVCVTNVAPNDVLNVRAEPSSRSQRVGFFDANDCHMNVEAVQGDWTYVRGSSRGRNMQGWVNNRYLRPVNAGRANPPQNFPQGNNRNGVFPLQAATGGGVVRGGPGTNYQRVTSLPEFAPITVTGHTGVMFNGYPWFTILYHGNRSGYMWGGIICSTNTPFQGTFDTCNNFRRSLQGNNFQPQQPQRPQPQQPRQTVHRNFMTFSCNEGIPLQVTFIADNTQAFALYSYDSGPQIRVSQVRSGSGLRYSDGFRELLSKGNEVTLLEGGQMLDRCFSN